VHRDLLNLHFMPAAVSVADEYNVQGNSCDKLHVELFVRSGCTRRSQGRRRETSDPYRRPVDWLAAAVPLAGLPAAAPICAACMFRHTAPNDAEPLLHIPFARHQCMLCCLTNSSGGPHALCKSPDWWLTLVRAFAYSELSQLRVSGSE